ncbi:MAG TPA: ATP-binding cassette domain-containing protein, partial [Thermoplasmata archaeon]|nr:ATP-binding cassette domain-containing protein [Thermoplasmata archaeon]
MLSLRDLRVWYPVRVGLIGGLVRGEAKHVRAVDGITFEVSRGEIFCLVGESGCGKTTTGKAILRLTDPTGGNILYNISQEDWDRLAAIEGRLKELGTPDAAAAREAEPQLRDLLRAKRQITQLLYPWSRVGAYLEREHLERNVAFLKERYASVYKGTDPSLERQLARGRERFEILREYGAWFTVRRAKKLRLLERSLKEAEYRLRIAEATHGRTRRFERQRRRVKRQLDRMARHIRKDSPEAQQQIAALEAKLETKKTLLRRLDLIDLKKEYDREKPRLEATRRASLEIPEAASQRIRELESEMETIREKGDRVLEALELETLRDELIARYDLAAWGKRHTAELRKRMQIIYQDPYESLNPKLSIFDIVAEPIMANKIVSTMSEAEAVVRKSLEDVGLKPAEEYMFRYPHELSGGQRQRVGIATALVVDPDFIVADEPVSMLDASVRTEILALLLDLRKRRNLTYLFITHDLGLAWIIADRIAVMYLGNIVEMGDGPEIIRNP